MPVTRRVMSQGDWSVRLRPDTPQSVLNAISTPFGEIVITAGRISVGAASISDTLALGAARYVGVVLRPGPQLELGGAGHEWWLGDDQGWQPIETALSRSAGTLTQWVGDIIPSPLTVGTISGAGTLGARYHWISRREALDSVCRSFGVEWRVNNNRTVDTGTQATLYGTTPTAIVVRRDGGREVSAPFGVNGVVSARWNFEGWVSRAVVLGPRGRSGAGTAVSYIDPAGATVAHSRAFAVDEAPYGTETTIATALRDAANATTREITVDTVDFDVMGEVTPGANIWLYDPWLGLRDTAQQQDYNGRKIHPVSVRVLGVTMPIERGMGVYYRRHDGTAPIYTDLTDWVEWEGPGGRLELGSPAMPLVDTSVPTPTAMTWNAWTEYTPSTNGITLGNGTVTAAYRREGSLLHVHGRLVAGSTTAVGAGVYQVALPGGYATGATLRYQLGKGQMTDVSTGFEYHLLARIGSSTNWIEFTYTIAELTVNSTPSTVSGPSRQINVSANQPFAIANGDTIEWTLTCEIAP